MTAGARTLRVRPRPLAREAHSPIGDQAAGGHAARIARAGEDQDAAAWMELQNGLRDAVRELVRSHKQPPAKRDKQARADVDRLVDCRTLPRELKGMDPVILRFMLRGSAIGVTSLDAVDAIAPGLLKRLAPNGLLPPDRLLEDGTIGWYVRDGRQDDCWASALATCLQIPIRDVPDARIDERLDDGDPPEQIDLDIKRATSRWLTKRGLQITFHRKLPVTKKRWIGICPQPGLFQDHCLVMCRGEVLHDPISVTATTQTVKTFGRGDVKTGVSFRALPTQGG